ncbi:MAG: bacterial proteasome activator family protein [Candidatus Nanopelagicales bacterium]|nr:bacterial proteasome activator family protein [Candidatus Nanopelagicales bacterium]
MTFPPSDSPSDSASDADDISAESSSVGDESSQVVVVADDDNASLVDLVEQPAKVMRIGSMIKQLLDEVRSAPLDEASRTRLAEIYAQSITELEEGLAPELVEELERLTLPFEEGSAPSDAELRIAQAQLVGWLEGLFHGIQTAMFAQQMAARAQFEEMRRRAAIGSGMDPDDGGPVPPGQGAGHSGPYL